MFAVVRVGFIATHQWNGEIQHTRVSKTGTRKAFSIYALHANTKVKHILSISCSSHTLKVNKQNAVPFKWQLNYT
jgi:hypothetical protein